MKLRTRNLMGLLAAGVLTNCTSSPASLQSFPPSIAFVGAHVVTMTSPDVLENHTVLVRQGRIISVGPDEKIKVPSNARRIDASGKYLMPGLAEMHGHIPPLEAPREFTDSVLFLYVANGITTVRGMLGHPGQLDLREQAARGETISPNLYLAGPSFNGNSINSVQEAIERVRAQKAEGWDLLKVHPGLTREEFDAMARTARREGIRFGGHVPEHVGLMHAIEMGQETFDHLDGYVEAVTDEEGDIDPLALAKAVEKTRTAGAWVVPTMALWETLYGTSDFQTLQSYPELIYMPRQQVTQWATLFENRLKEPSFDAAASRKVIENRTTILRALHEGGVRILMGTDAPQQYSVPGFSLHRELLRMSAAGMSPYQILRTGTANVGLYFKAEDDFGTVETGKRADLLLVGGNPLEDLRNIQKIDGVMVRGRWISAEEIRSGLDRIAAANR